MSLMRRTRTPLVTKQQLASKREHELTERQEKRLEIQIAYKNGISRKELKQQFSPYLVNTWVDKLKENDMKLSYMGKKIPGRLLKVTDEVEEDILRMIKKQMSLQRMANFLTDKYKDEDGYKKNGKMWSISTTTISRHLEAIGAFSRARGKQPAITVEQEKKRVKLAKELKDENLEKFVFVDETWAADHGRINARNDRQWVFDPNEIVPRKQVAHPAKIGYFGGITSEGVTPLIEIFRDDKPTFEEVELKQSRKILKKLAEERKKAEEKEAKRLKRIEREKLKEEKNLNNRTKKTKTQIKKEADRRRKEKDRIREEKAQNKERVREEKKVERIRKRMENAGKKNMRNRTTAKIYIKCCLKPLIKHLDLIWPERDYTIVHDGAPYHSAKMVSQFLDDKRINFIGGGAFGKWPGNSPDLNPIENGWAIAKGNAYREPTRNLDELDKRFREAYNNIGRGTCQKMITGMKNRFEKVIQLKGKYIGK